MNTKLIKEIIKEENMNAVILEEFNDALIGTGKICGKKPIAAYSTDKVLKILMGKNNIGEMEAYEIFKATIDNAFPDANDPVFINNFTKIVDPQDVLNSSHISPNDTIDKLNS